VRYRNPTFRGCCSLRRCVLVLCVAALSLAAPNTALSADWPEFHFSADRSGFNPSETTLGRGNVSQLALSWRTTISVAPLSTPVVGGGRLYVGSNDGSLYALNAVSGAIVWRGATGASIPHSPAVGEGRVFVGSDDGKVYAFPTSCVTPCTPLWTTSTGGVSADPAISNGVVFVGAFGTGLVALDAVTGAVLWTAPLSSAPVAIAIDSGVVYASDGGTLYAFPTSCSTPCAPLWLGQVAGGRPAVGAGAVFVDAGFVNIFSSFPSTASCSTPCSPLWMAFTNSASSRTPAIAGTTVYHSEGDGTLAAYPVSCVSFCTPSWTSFIGGFVSDPAVANGVVYVGTDDAMEMFNSSTGALISSVPTGSTTRSPAVVNGTVYASTFDFTAGGRVSAYGLAPSDTTPPQIAVPDAITVNATSSSGAVVTYTVTATDPDDAVASLACAPASGATFPIGTTTVLCAASDTNGNTSTATFTVHVKGSSEQLADLLAAVTGVGPGTSLADKVRSAQSSLAANQLAAACSTLTDFISAVKAQSGKKISAGDANALIADARRIQTVMSC
jgi:eukaryotic-like serine/threonine-protein kinase